MDFTSFTNATSRAELLGPEEKGTTPALVAGNVAKLTHPSDSAQRASLRTFTTSCHNGDVTVKRMTVWDSRDEGNRAELLGSAAGDTRRTGSVQIARPAVRGEDSTHPTHYGLDLHEVVPGRWASDELVRGRMGPARAWLRGESEFARIHHHRPLGPRIFTGACCLVAVYGIALCLQTVNREAAFWIAFGLSLMGAAMLIHGLEIAVPRAKRLVLARVRGAQS